MSGLNSSLENKPPVELSITLVIFGHDAEHSTRNQLHLNRAQIVEAPTSFASSISPLFTLVQVT
jgi:hypothetical protein